MSLAGLFETARSLGRRLILPVIALLGLALALLVVPAALAGGQYGSLPVSLQAIGMADYSGGESDMALQPLQLAVIADVLRDRDPDADDSVVRLTAVADSMLTPVPSPEVEEAAATVESTPTAAASGSPTEFAIPPGTGTGTATPTVTGTVTMGPTQTASPTVTPGGPSATPAATDPPPTATNPPPTPTVNVCGSLFLDDFHWSGPIVRWELHNNSGTSASVTSISLVWPAGNGTLTVVDFGGAEIWDQGDDNPPTSLSGSWSLGAGSSKRLRFEFSELAAPGGYDVSVNFSNGCSAGAAN